jgi:hypothetical protein
VNALIHESMTAYESAYWHNAYTHKNRYLRAWSADSCLLCCLIDNIPLTDNDYEPLLTFRKWSPFR